MPLQIQTLMKSVQSNIVALPQTGNSNLFAITGDVFVVAITGVVTTAIGAVANATKLQVVCGALTAVDLCGTTDINGFAAGYLLTPITSFATALGNNANGVVVGTAPIGVLIACGTTGAGVIRVNTAGSDGGTGRIRWSVAYMPMSSGAQIASS